MKYARLRWHAIIIAAAMVACGDMGQAPDTAYRVDLKDSYERCFARVGADLGIDLGKLPDRTESERGLARLRIIAAVNRAADEGSPGEIELPYLLLSEWRDSGGELHPVYHLRCDPQL